MFESLHRRSRGRIPSRVLARLTGGRVPAAASATDLGRQGREQALVAAELAAREEAVTAREAAVAHEATVLAPWSAELRPWDPAAHELPPYPHEAGPVSRALLDRLDANDIALLEQRLEDTPAAYWAQADPVTRGYLTLTFGTHYEVEPILAKTGLSPAMPPEQVHAMARGPLAAGGDPFIADFVMAAIERSGRPLATGARGLDFGCSSGRVVRVLALARPDVEWLGCDPNERAIAWAAAHIGGVRAFVSPLSPPLDLEDASLDLVYAISIWSHFDANAGLDWIAEMARLLRPGGRLVMTTHGITSVGRHLRDGSMLPEAAAECASALYYRGFWFAEVFGARGDAGVVSREWGMSYMTPEWLLPRVLTDWTLRLYEPGRLDVNQDLYVLQRN